MTSATFILCPGQGAQAVGMGKDFFDASPEARETFELANRIIGFDLGSICFTGPDDRLNQTDISQPAIFTTSVACYRAAVALGTIKPGEVTAYAGLSLGEYTALHLAGVFDFETGLKLVAARGRYMQEAAVATPSGMVALIGMDDGFAGELCDEASEGEILVPANYNAPGQIVVSGTRSACARILAKAEAKGIKAVALKVAGAFHSPIMQSGADRMKAELAPITFESPAVTVYSNVTAQPHGSVSTMKSLLVDQIVRPVRWAQTMQALIAQGGDVAKFIELAPGRTLAGLAKRINRRLPVQSLETFTSLTA